MGQRSNQALRNATIIIVVGILATTLPQTEVLARLPLQNLLKNELGLDRSANAAFFFWIGLAWYLKPLVGIVTDAFPLFGKRRRSYLLVGALLAAIAWLAMIPTSHAYGKMLLVAIALNMFMVVCSTVVGGYIVETAHAIAGSGRLTATRQLVQQACLIINGPIAGYLAGIAFAWTALACSSVLALLVPVTMLFLREQQQRITSREVLANAVGHLNTIARARTMWGAVALMALFYAAPGFSTAIFYRQQNELHMDTHMQGFLGFIAGACGVVAAVSYGALCRRLSLRSLLVLCLTAGTGANLGYLLYSSWERAQLIDGLNGFGYTLAELALMDLAVRATPAGSEGLGFALMVSIRNFALFGTDWFGSQLLDSYHISFSWLVLATAATTAFTVPLVFLLPASLVALRDGERVEGILAATPVSSLEEEKE